MPAEWNGSADVEIELLTDPGLRYERDVITVPAGSKVAFTFTNDDDMIHNVVIVEPGTADEVGVAAMNLGLDAGDMEYVPPLDGVLCRAAKMGHGAGGSRCVIAR